MSIDDIPAFGKIGEDDHSRVLTYLAGLVRESDTARSEWVTEAERNERIYLRGTDTEQAVADDVVTACDVQDAIISFVHTQTREPIRTTLEPVETGEPPVVFWARGEDVPMMGQLEPTTGVVVPTPVLDLQPGQIMPDPMMGGRLMPLTDAQALQAQLLVQQGVLKERDIVEFSDRLVADTYQTVFNVYWQRSQTDQFIQSVLLRNNIQGWAWGLYQFDSDEKRHDLEVLSVKAVYIDPTVMDVRKASYVIVDQTMDAMRAARAYPQFAEEIMEYAKDGQQHAPEGTNTLGGTVDGVDFERPMVVLRIAWLRNQQIPYTPEQAVEAGMLMPEQIGQMTVDDEAWPKKWGVRQITALCSGPQGVIVDDRECEHWDIPVLHNVNIPVTGTPFGQGEPQRLWKMQEAKGRLLNALVKHADYYRAPIEQMPESVARALEQAYGNAYIEPGEVMRVPDGMWQQFEGRMSSVSVPPPIPAAVMEGLAFLNKELTERSGHAEVLQGRTQPQVRSGVAIERLQDAAMTMIGFKSQATGYMVERASMMMLHSLVWRLSVEDIAKIVSRYPVNVLAEIHRRARELEWNVSVNVSSGTGAILQRKKQEAMAERQAGLISLETYHEESNRDHQMEKKRMDDEQSDAMRMQAEMQPMGPANNPAP